MRLAVPDGWHVTRPDEGAVLLAAVGPADAVTGLAPSLLASADPSPSIDQVLRTSLPTLVDPHTVVVDVAGGRAVVSHDVAGIGVTLCLRLLPDQQVLVAATVTDRLWPTLRGTLERTLRSAAT